MTDNKDKIKDLLKFDNSNNDCTYYYVQIIKRRKDNPDLERNEIKIGSFFLTDENKLEEYWNFIKERADKENARVYISLNPRSLRRFTALCLMEYSKRVMNNSFDKSWKIPDSCALNKNSIKTRGITDSGRWVVDVDSNSEEIKNGVGEFIKTHTKILHILKTPNGFHLIVSPFNYRKLDTFRISKSADDYKIDQGYEFTLRREGNTILYAP